MRGAQMSRFTSTAPASGAYAVQPNVGVWKGLPIKATPDPAQTTPTTSRTISGHRVMARR